MTKPSEKWIYHILPAKVWEEAQKEGVYTPLSLETEGFIHCSKINQVLRSANRYYSGQSDLLVLVIDPDAVQAVLRYEDLVGAGQLFPHVHGALNLDAVVGMRCLEARNDGSFILSDRNADSS